MKYIAIIFTFMSPHVPAMEQPIEMRDKVACERFIARTRKVYEKADNNFRWQLECKKNKKRKKS